MIKSLTFYSPSPVNRSLFHDLILSDFSESTNVCDVYLKRSAIYHALFGFLNNLLSFFKVLLLVVLSFCQVKTQTKFLDLGLFYFLRLLTSLLSLT